jgi:hypothetical protein
VLFVELKEAAAAGPAHRGGTGHGQDAPPPGPAIGPS